ncbi:hypothetical protein B566_EDAN013365 [Ephemera danica]|nr:hypothetical protein B566_EDAN013365 [Ephemera danica]
MFFDKVMPFCQQLKLTSDTEAGLGDQQFAFDNPGFLTEDSASTLPNKKPPIKAKPTAADSKAVVDTKHVTKDVKNENSKVPKNSGKWQAWSPLSALVGGGSGKQKDNRRTLDDSFVGEPERNVVALRGHDFTGLGFNICGNMRDGIFVRDVLHRGPASESGLITAGDRIIGINISFKHMVFEDALTILSYASPYDVQLEVEKSTLSNTTKDTGSGKRSPSMRRSSLSARKAKIKKSPSNSPGPVGVIGSSSTYSGSRDEAKLEQSGTAPDNPRLSRTSVSMPKPERAKKPNGKPAPEEVKTNPKTPSPHMIEKHTKFGIRVLPPNIGEMKVAGGTSESTQNEQNIKIEQKTTPITDTVQPMTELIMELKGNPKKLEDDTVNTTETITCTTHVDTDVVDSNIPTEIPEEMRLAAMAAKSNRKSLSIDKQLSVAPVKPEIPAKPELDFSSGGESAADGNDTPRKNAKRKAPPPPSVPKTVVNTNTGMDSDDSDVELGDHKSKVGGKTIELNSAHITIHQSPKEEESAESNEAARNRDRKTASLGDLSRLESEHPMSIPLERAVSLDMADVTAPVTASGSDSAVSGTAKKRKAPVVPEDDMEKELEESDDEDNAFSVSTSHHFSKKEPRLMPEVGMSDTFRRRLKKSSDWGTLEEAMLVGSDTEQSHISSSHHVVLVSGSQPSSLQSSTISSSNKSPSVMQCSDVVSVQVVTSSTLEPTTSSSSPLSMSSLEVSSSEPLVDSSDAVEFVSTTVELGHPQFIVEENVRPPELPTSPMPKAQTSVREFSLASPNNAPSPNFHHSMTYITTAAPVSPQHHVTEIQVLTGGNVSTSMPFTSENAVESTTTVRHGTSGGNLLLLPSLTMNGPESLEDTMSSFTSTHSETEEDPIVRLESPANNVTVMSINTNGIINHMEHNNDVSVSNKILDTTTKESREVLQITPGELDSVMMSHSHYLLSTQAQPEISTSGGTSSTFEQWVFLDNRTPPHNGLRHLESPNDEEPNSTAVVTKSSTTSMVLNVPNLQSVTHIMLESDSKPEKESKIKLSTPQENQDT